MNLIHLAVQATSLAGGTIARAADAAGIESAVGYYVIWNVTPALHSPLMSLTNGISSVIIVGALLATGLATSAWATGFGFFAVALASVNIFGGFLVTYRMLSMFKSKKKA
jgi:NAD(P) transhydrogenase subunit alpha